MKLFLPMRPPNRRSTKALQLCIGLGVQRQSSNQATPHVNRFILSINEKLGRKYASELSALWELSMALYLNRRMGFIFRSMNGIHNHSEQVFMTGPKRPDAFHTSDAYTLS